MTKTQRNALRFGPTLALLQAGGYAAPDSRAHDSSAWELAYAAGLTTTCYATSETDLTPAGRRALRAYQGH